MVYPVVRWRTSASSSSGNPPFSNRSSTESLPPFSHSTSLKEQREVGDELHYAAPRLAPASTNRKKRIIIGHLKAMLMTYRKLLISPIYSKKEETVLFLCSLVYFIMIATVPPVGATIDCFKCVSINGDNPSCEDPFHNNYSASILEAPCMGGRKGRNGLFPATACMKLAGVFQDDLTSIMIRGCALDSGTLTADTEIIRMSHCGSFYFDSGKENRVGEKERYVKGCLKSCDDVDGCNHASRPNTRPTSTFVLYLLIPFQLLTTLHYFRLDCTTFL